mgnify:CR=1 FL=1
MNADAADDDAFDDGASCACHHHQTVGKESTVDSNQQTHEPGRPSKQLHNYPYTLTLQLATKMSASFDAEPRFLRAQCQLCCWQQCLLAQ